MPAEERLILHLDLLDVRILRVLSCRPPPLRLLLLPRPAALKVPFKNERSQRLLL